MNPDLSVILVTRGDLTVLRLALGFLAAQTVRERMEIIVAAPRELPAEDGIRVVVVGEIKTLAGAQVAAIRHARAPVVALGEDHSFPAPDWAEKLLQAHSAGHAAVAPLLLNGNPNTLSSWANYLLHFGRFGDPAVAGVVEWLPWHNTSYKRDILLGFGDQLPLFIAVEGLLHEALRVQGHTLFLHATTSTRHINFSRFGPFLIQTFCGGHLFSAARARHQRWPWTKRLLYAAATPLIPVVRGVRILRDIAARPQQRPLLPQVIPLLAAGLAAHALGEMYGNLFGLRGAEERYLIYETDRLGHVTAADRRELTGS